MASKKSPQNRYLQLIEKIFFGKYHKGASVLPFERGDLENAARELKIDLPKNLGDVIYAIRYRIDFPKFIECERLDMVRLSLAKRNRCMLFSDL